MTYIRNFGNSIAGLVLALSLFTLSASAQTWTTVTNAIDSKTKFITLGSVTGVAAPSNPVSTSSIGTPSGTSFTILYVDGEAMGVFTVNTTTKQVLVSRGWQSTTATAHVAGAKVAIINANQFNVYDASSPLGFFSRYTVGAAVASAATIVPTGPIFHVTGTAAIVNITAPSYFTLSAGCMTLIPDGIYTTTNAGNIAIASTAVVSKAMIMCYDPVATKWYPSY